MDIGRNIWLFVQSFNWITDTLDILVVAFVIYFVLRLIRDSRAEQLLKGVLLLAALYFVSFLLNLSSLNFLLNTLFSNGLLLIVIIFQPEFRRALEAAGHSRLGAMRIFGLNGENADQYVQLWKGAIAAVCSAAETLQNQKMGALIVLERSTRLSEIAHTGTILDADATPELIGNVFFNKAPLHDGAMIIRDGRVHAAGCILPLTDNAQLSRELGTRHRAAVGISENSDALVVVVSEETGTLSVAVGGELKRNFSQEALRIALENGMLWERIRLSGEGDKTGWWTRATQWFKGRKSS